MWSCQLQAAAVRSSGRAGTDRGSKRASGAIGSRTWFNLLRSSAEIRNDEAAASCWLDSGCCACPCALLGCAVSLPFGMTGAGRTAPDSSELQKQSGAGLTVNMRDGHRFAAGKMMHGDTLSHTTQFHMEPRLKRNTAPVPRVSWTGWRRVVNLETCKQLTTVTSVAVAVPPPAHDGVVTDGLSTVVSTFAYNERMSRRCYCGHAVRCGEDQHLHRHHGSAEVMIAIKPSS